MKGAFDRSTTECGAQVRPPESQEFYPGQVAVVMLSGAALAAERLAATAFVILLMLFIGPLWLLSLACGEDRRQYVAKINGQVMQTARSALHGRPWLAPDAWHRLARGGPGCSGGH